MRERHRRKHRFIRQHSLSIASASILGLWICLYSVSNPRTHLGSFFGNAIADWSGVVVMVLATKYLYEKGSAESRRPPKNLGIHVCSRREPIIRRTSMPESKSCTCLTGSCGSMTRNSIPGTTTGLSLALATSVSGARPAARASSSPLPETYFADFAVVAESTPTLPSFSSSGAASTARLRCALAHIKMSR